MTQMNDQPAQSHSLIVTIDGPAGSGKSTVARELAGRLGLDSLDTGAMYRCLTLVVIEERLDPADPAAVVRAVERHRIDFDWTRTPPEITLDGRAVDERLRQPDVNELVSRVASIPELRDLMVRAQRRIAQRHPRLVTEGRDQGSVVFPDAEVRFYLDADSKVRARRRALELQASGQQVDERAILESIQSRDRLDRERSDSPLQVPDGAIRVDTGALTASQVVDELESAVRGYLVRAASGGPA